MSKTGFQPNDPSLKGSNASSVCHVLSAGAELKVVGFVSFVVVFSVEFEGGGVPSWEGKEVTKELSFVGAPRLIDEDASTTIIGVISLVGVVATLKAGADSVEEAPSVGVVVDDVGVSTPILLVLSAGFLCAGVAAGASSSPEVGNMDRGRRASAGALDCEANDPTASTQDIAEGGKFAPA
jgi:hypothetical protein